jgi:signal peptidase I
VVVLIVNQYVLQAYAVPSASMENTIVGEDRLFVDKMIYGPELIPGYGKLPGARAKRGDIVVFLNPDYRNEMGRDVSPVEELFNRLIYMLTFTLVNRDVNAEGEIAKHFLVKRLIGQPGEQLRMRDGRVQIKPVGAVAWVPEEELKDRYNPITYTLQKKFYPYDKYPIIRDYVVMLARLKAGLPVPDAAPVEDRYLRLLCGAWFGGDYAAARSLDAATLDLNYQIATLVDYKIYTPAKKKWPADKIMFEYKKKILAVAGVKGLEPEKITQAEADREYKKLILAYNNISTQKIEAMSPEELDAAYSAAAVKHYYTGELTTDKDYERYWLARTACGIDPADESDRSRLLREDLGWYIPNDRFFPMGDNRDNSRDARFFDPVNTKNLLGRSLFRFWPLNRIGVVR